MKFCRLTNSGNIFSQDGLKKSILYRDQFRNQLRNKYRGMRLAVANNAAKIDACKSLSDKDLETLEICRHNLLCYILLGKHEKRQVISQSYLDTFTKIDNFIYEQKPMRFLGMIDESDKAQSKILERIKQGRLYLAKDIHQQVTNSLMIMER